MIDYQEFARINDKLREHEKEIERLTNERKATVARLYRVLRKHPQKIPYDFDYIHKYLKELPGYNLLMYKINKPHTNKQTIDHDNSWREEVVYARRAELVGKKSIDGLTSEEADELEKINETAVKLGLAVPPDEELSR